MTAKNVNPLCEVDNLHSRVNPDLYVAGVPDRSKPRLVFNTSDRDVARRAYMKATGIHKDKVRACNLAKYDRGVDWK